MNIFCTLFDSNYLHFGLTMYDSLKECSDDFILYIFTFDDRCFEELSKLELRNVVLVPLEEFEDNELLVAKNTRSKVEYCWTCTPSIILHVLKKYKVHECTYLDADLFFYQNPKILIDEMGDNSVLLTSHNFSKAYEKYAAAGIYCVQFMTFKNDERALIALNWWRNACLEWCFDKFEDNKYGDQKYLDDWLDRFEGVYVLKNEGGGVAPWNVQKFKITSENDKLLIGGNSSIVFYHFHNFKFVSSNQINFGWYVLSNKAIQLIYIPYLKRILKYKGIYSNDFEYKNIGLSDVLRIVKRFVKRKFVNYYNVYYVVELL